MVQLESYYRGTILIVDDELENLSVLSDTLAQQGYKIRKALSGKLALDSIDVLPPDLIVLDIKMPDMSGFEVCKILQSQAKTQAIPIIFISVLSSSADIVKGFNLGCVDYISKPFRTEEVLARVDRQMTILELQRALRKKNIALQENNQELQRASKVREEFLDTVTHELRTPLSNIKMALSMLRMTDDLAKQERYFDLIETELEHEFSLVGDLLELRRSSQKIGDIELSVISLQNWIPSLVEPFFERIHTSNRTITVMVAEALPPVQIGVDIFQRIIIELLNNACKYTPPNGGITISASAVTAPQPISIHQPSFPQLELIFSNSSPELPEGDLVKIFEQFYRSDASYTSPIRSTGLGLSLVKKLVEQLNGSIRASYKNTQIHFSLLLPIKI